MIIEAMGYIVHPERQLARARRLSEPFERPHMDSLPDMWPMTASREVLAINIRELQGIYVGAVGMEV